MQTTRSSKHRSRQAHHEPDCPASVSHVSGTERGTAEAVVCPQLGRQGPPATARTPGAQCDETHERTHTHTRHHMTHNTRHNNNFQPSVVLCGVLCHLERELIHHGPISLQHVDEQQRALLCGDPWKAKSSKLQENEKFKAQTLKVSRSRP